MRSQSACLEVLPLRMPIFWTITKIKNFLLVFSQTHNSVIHNICGHGYTGKRSLQYIYKIFSIIYRAISSPHMTSNSFFGMSRPHIWRLTHFKIFFGPSRRTTWRPTRAVTSPYMTSNSFFGPSWPTGRPAHVSDRLAPLIWRDV